MINMKQKTYMAKPADVAAQYYIIDAKDKILGRVAAKAATVLRGKHKPTFTPHVDNGHYVIIINAEKIRVTGKKLQDKIYKRYTGYPSGQRKVTLESMLDRKPTQVLRLAVNRMIPDGSLGDRIRRKLRIYTGDKHPHIAQKPITITI